MWDPRQNELYSASGGRFNPDEAAKLRKPELPPPDSIEGCFSARVSVVCPTTDSRHEFHGQLWAVFDAQAWPDKELVIVETYVDRPSPFFTEKAKEDDRVIYVSYKVPRGQDWSIGLKRNMGTHLASGLFMANFDDDDLYAPSYLNVMLQDMLEQKSEAITLSTYYVFDVRAGKFGWTDQRYASESTRYGYGFSYVYMRVAALYHQYPNQNMGEDFCFFNALRHRRHSTAFGGERHVALHVDENGICCHTLHPKATSSVYAKRQVPFEEVEGLDVADLGDLLGEYVGRFPQTQGMSDYIGRVERREQKVTVHSSAGDYHLTCLVGAAVSEVQELLHGQMQCGGSPGDVHLHGSCPPCLCPEAEAEAATAESLQASAQQQAVLGAPALEGHVRVGPRRAEFWATLPPDRLEEPRVSVRVRDVRSHGVSVTVKVNKVERLGGVREALIQQHGTKSDAGRRVARGLKLAERFVRPGMEGLDEGVYYKGCDPERWLLDKREFFAMGLMEVLEQNSKEKGTTMLVRIKGKSSESFVLAEVPSPNKVSQLRTLIPHILPPEAQLFADGGDENAGPSTTPLEEEDRLPALVIADQLHSTVADSIFCSRDMAVRVQHRCIEELRRPETQEMFDLFEAESGGNSNKYRNRMLASLPEGAYAPVLQYYGLPQSRRGVMLLSASIQAHFTVLDWDMTMNWFEVEKLCRNRAGMQAAEAQIDYMSARSA